MKKPLLPVLYLLLCSCAGFSQRDFYKSYSFDHADTLRGMLRPERTCYDVTFYDLNIGIDISKKFIKGYVDIYFDAVSGCNVIQIDLFKNMEIIEITFYDQPLTYNRIENAVFVYLPMTLPRGSSATIRVSYQGFPQVARNAPWDGGFVWSQDPKGNPWVGVACEGTGASLWWPCKDHLSDEPDSVAIHVAVPNGLSCISNGNLRNTSPLDENHTLFYWFVSYPINNYGISLNIGSYSHFSDTYIAGDGDSLALDYYVLPDNLKKAKKQFKQVKPMLTCYEKYFGKYPFWNDGYALVETPYLGMEHQSCIAYGNNYKRGYLGGMIPRDMDWDYIVVHESGHEYFGNAVSVRDHCDMWIHESFATYMEALYVECTYSYDDAVRYLEGQRPFIRNFEPILGPTGVNFFDWRGSDHYFKGSWVLHTLRNALDDDEVFFGMLRGFYDKYKYTTCSTEDFIAFVNEYTGKNCDAFFEQYLWYPGIPKLVYTLDQKGKDLKMTFRWEANVPGFDMPVKIGKQGAYTTIFPVTGTSRKVLIPNLKKSDFRVATEMFYIREKEVKDI